MATSPAALFTGSLAGDVIIQARETVPDMPPTLPAPTLVSLTPVVDAPANIPNGTYFVVITTINQWGESLPSAELSTTLVGPNNAIQVAYLAPGNIGSFRAYIGTAAGQEFICNFIANAAGNPFTILSLNQGTTGGVPAFTAVPPLRNTAWIPDADGDFISASAIYRWLNAALKIVAKATGGFQDYSAVGSVINQPFYVIPANWNAITDIWYDGYWMAGGDPGFFFRRNAITSQILSSAHVSMIGQQMTLEVYPQPARTSITTTVAVNMGATDTSVTLTNGAFTLPFGFASLGAEVVAYSVINGNTLNNLIRGLGGTPAVGHNAGEPAVECNIAWLGKRQSTVAFTPGQAAVTLPITSAWDQLLIEYISGRAKIVEHDLQSLNAFNADMEKQIKDWAKVNRGVVRRRQAGGNNYPATYYADIAGGILIN